MKDNRDAVWDAVNEFKNYGGICYECDWQGTARKPSHWRKKKNKLLPTDVADRWRLPGIVGAVGKRKRRRAAASHLIEHRKAFRQRAREFSSGPGKLEQIHLEGLRSQTEPELRHQASPLSSATLLMRTGCVAMTACESLIWRQMPWCLSVFTSSTLFKQIIIFRDERGFLANSSPQIRPLSARVPRDDRSRPECTAVDEATSEPDPRQGKYMIYIWNDKNYERSVSRRSVQTLVSRTDCRWCQGFCARNRRRLLTNCRLWFYWCLTLKPI